MRPYLVRYVSLHFLTVICFCSILMVHVLVRKPFKNECPIPLILYTRVFITHQPHGLWGIFEIWTGEGILSMASSWFRCVEESSSRRHVTMNFSSLISRCFFNVSIFFVRKMHVPCLRLSKTAGEVADMHWMTRGSAVVIFKDAESAKKATETLHKSNLALPWIPLDANKTPKNLGTWEETHTNIRDISEFGKLSWGLENDNALSKNDNMRSCSKNMSISGRWFDTLCGRLPFVWEISMNQNVQSLVWTLAIAKAPSWRQGRIKLKGIFEICKEY